MSIPSDATAPAVDYATITARQQATWSEGDFNVLALAVMPASDNLVAALDVRGGEKVLDIACGSGNAALVAARRNADVFGIDYVPALVARARERARAEGTTVDFREGDAQSLPFPDGTFDVVLSVFGVMFAPDQARAAGELLRVARPGGRIGIASWMPEEYGGDFFRVHAKYLPPPAGLVPPTKWGTEGAVRELLGASVSSSTLSFERRTFHQYYRSEAHALETFCTYFGPTRRVLASLEAARKREFEADLLEVLHRYNRAKDGSAVIESAYLQVLGTKA